MRNRVLRMCCDAVLFLFVFFVVLFCVMGGADGLGQPVAVALAAAGGATLLRIALAAVFCCAARPRPAATGPCGCARHAQLKAVYDETHPRS